MAYKMRPINRAIQALGLCLILLSCQSAVPVDDEKSAASNQSWTLGEQGSVEWKHSTGVPLDTKVRDMTVSENGELIFALTPKQVLIYSSSEKKILDRIAIHRDYDRIVFAQPDRLILTSHSPPAMNIIQYRRIYDVNISGRPYKGPQDAKVTIAVFDDYQ